VSRLETPIKGQLREPFEEAALQRMWMQIDGRLPVARRRRRRSFAGGLAFAAAAAGVALFAVSGRDAGPLRFHDGTALRAVDAAADGARVALSDGSSIQLGAGARFEPLESSGTSFLAVLQRGRADFEVRPGGPRRWQVECGLATVEVVGTRFSCDREEPGRLRVSVQRGEVVVRGERITDRARRLVAGESLDVFEAADADAGPAAVVPPAAAEEPSAGDVTVTARVERAPVATTSSSWRQLAHDGRHKEAFAALGTQGVQRESQRLGVAELLELADVARLSGHPREAVAPLERILRDFERDPQAPLAAFALGRLQLDALAQPRLAAAALERALALGVPRSLDDDVRARLVEAHDRAGNHAAALAAARAYLHHLPTGHHRAAMESRLSAP
jgi:transmembrane sensor